MKEEKVRTLARLKARVLTKKEIRKISGGKEAKAFTAGGPTNTGGIPFPDKDTSSADWWPG